MLVRWNDRPTPIRQMRCGGAPVMSLPSSSTCPASGCRCPVMRLKKVDLPAPLGPITAAISPRATARLTQLTAMKPSKALRRERTSSMAHRLRCRPRFLTPAARCVGQRADDPAGEGEEEHDQHRAENERPVFGVGGDLLVEEDERSRAYRRPPEMPHPAEDRHDQRLGRLRPKGEVREDAAVEDAEERAREPSKEAGDDEGGELVASHVDADELRPLRIVADEGEDTAERRKNEPAQGRERERDEDERDQIESLADAEGVGQRQLFHPAELGIRHVRQALLAASHLVPLEAYCPNDLREGERQHGEIDFRETHAEEAEHGGKAGGDDAAGDERQRERRRPNLRSEEHT